jgi:3'-phosphoadenosine 5'-phosphosulfate (PAPS) 3'-phosphatase
VVDRGDLGLVNKNDVGVVGDFSRDVKKPQTPRTTSSFLYEYDPEIDAQTEADRRVEAHVLRALRAFCPELTVVAEESYENPDAAIPESDDFRRFTKRRRGDRRAVPRVAEKRARGRARAGHQ